MNHLNVLSVLIASIFLGSSSASAETVIGCPPGWTLASLSLELTAASSLDNAGTPTCPLLEDQRLRRLVDDFGAGTTFAYPFGDIPTCLSGILESGTFSIGSEVYDIDISESFTESAQRFFPVPEAQGYPINYLFAPSPEDLFAFALDGSPHLPEQLEGNPPPSLQVGAAMTLLHLEGQSQSPGSPLKLDILVDDHFLLNSSGQDVEDFRVVGSKGSYAVMGRISGQGEIVLAPPFGPLTVQFDIHGDVCVKCKGQQCRRAAGKGIR